MRFILLGAPGSGKGTQAKSLGEHYNLERISLGDILRQEVKNESELGRKVKTYMEKGLLVPDEIISLVVAKHIHSDDFILDGYPRNLAQAKELDVILGKKKISLDFAVYLEVNEETMLKRLSGRRVCPHCDANYHIENMPPQKEGVCDLCGCKLLLRRDDKPEVIRKRWEVFVSENMPLRGYYKEKQKLIVIDANGEASEVLQNITDKLNGKQ